MMNIVLCVGAAWVVVMAIWWALGAWDVKVPATSSRKETHD